MVYDRDISQAPLHVFEYMFGIIMSELLAWEPDVDKLIFNELTLAGIKSISCHIRMNINSNTFGRVPEGRQVPLFTVDKLITPDKSPAPSGPGPVLCSNGMGRDGLVNLALVKEITQSPPVSVTVGNQYTTRALWHDRVRTNNDACRLLGVEPRYVKTDFMRRARFKIIPWWVFALPLAYVYDSNSLTSALEIGLIKTHTGTPYPGLVNCSTWSLENLSRATGVHFSSPTYALSRFMVQYILANRYPGLMPYQRSCMTGRPWCGKCKKCVQDAIMLQASGFNPENIGLPRINYKSYNRYITSLKPKRKFFTMQNIDHMRAVWDRAHGSDYESWIDTINEPYLELTETHPPWDNGRLRKIFTEYFGLGEFVAADRYGFDIDFSSIQESLNHDTESIGRA